MRFLSEDGKLLTFGEKDEGKLGQGTHPSDPYTPQEVIGMKGKVTWASCGGSHTIAVTGEYRTTYKWLLHDLCSFAV